MTDISSSRINWLGKFFPRDYPVQNISPANKYAQEIVITLDETGEEIYRSGLLLPNYHIQKDKLSKNLEKGEYNCTATFVGYDTESEKDPIRIGAAAANLEIKKV